MTAAHDLQPGPTALYAQVASIIRSQIASGVWCAHDALPAIEVLCERYGVSRITVRQAIAMLVSEGLLISRRGRRTTVAERTAPAAPPRFRDVVDAMAEPDSDFQIVFLDRADRVSLPDGVCFVGTAVEQYCRVRKIHKTAGVPYCVMELYIDQSIVDRWPRNALRREKLAPLLITGDAPGIALGRERIIVASADFDEAQALEYPMAGPVARMIRILCDPQHRAVYVGRFTYRGDRFGVEREHGPYVKQPWEQLRRRRN